MTEVNINPELKSVVRSVLNNFMQEAHEVMRNLEMPLISQSDAPIFLSSNHANVFKAILQSQKENIEYRIIKADSLGTEASGIIDYFRRLIADLENVKFTDDVF